MKIQQYLDKVEKYRDQVMKITREYCDNQNTQKSTELDEVFFALFEILYPIY